jgi:two-component system alkaline phosphatase synthesis response regulator PhoP
MSEPRGSTVVIVGLAGEPTNTLAADIARLGYTVKLVVWSGAVVEMGSPPPVATVLDLRVLGAHAESACRAVRENRSLRQAPVIALVFEQEGPRLDLSLGFDDLILAPYRLSELAARLRLARWRTESESSPDVLRLGAVTLNTVTYEVFVNRVPVELTLKEYQLLLFLAQNPGRVFTREQLLDRVWESNYYGGTRTVDVHIRRLRAKTAMAGDLLETVRGVGYRLVPPRPEDD